MDFFPKSIDFFKRFDALANIIHELGNLVEKLHIRSSKLVQLEKDARKMEEKADAICHQLFQKINQTFITPIDREDIYTLAVSLDTMIDFIENLVSNIHTFSVKKEEKEFKTFLKLISESCQNVTLLVKDLKYKERKISHMREIIVKINKIENSGDKLTRRALIMATILNILGTFSGTAVAATIGKGIIKPELINLTTVAAAMIAIIFWSTLAWRYGLPTSESHALISGLAGAGLAIGGFDALLIEGWTKVGLGLLFSTFLGFGFAYFLFSLIARLFYHTGISRVRRFFGRAQ